MATIYNYKPGDKVITPTGKVATVVKETYQGERLRNVTEVTLQKEFVKPLKQELYSTCQVVYR